MRFSREVNFMYSQLVRQHFECPQYIGQLFPGPQTFVGEVFIRGGDRIKLGIATENTYIKDIRHQVYGCPAMIACMSWLAAEILHKEYEDVRQYTASYINAALSLPEHKYRCALLAEQVLEKVLDEWYNSLQVGSSHE